MTTVTTNGGTKMNAEMKRTLDAGIKNMVDRFLSWKLPKDFNPDAGISFDKGYGEKWGMPNGTNLFDATQAEAMIRHLVNVPEEEVTQPTEKPKPCPFCGGENIELHYEGPTLAQAWHAYCHNCGATGSNSVVKAMAIAGWNDRHE